MDSEFCIDAVEDALATYGETEIVNTDQGSQFTSELLTGVLKRAGIRISMDGKGCWRDNVFVERVWRSIKYEDVYLRAYASVSEAKQGIGNYVDLYNQRRPHSKLDKQTPDEFYSGSLPQLKRMA